MLVVDRLTKRFGGFTAVDKVSFQLERGEILGLIGPNGAGKSTVFNLISGFIPPTSGKLSFDGVDITRLKAPALNPAQALYVSGTLKTGRVMVKDEDVCLHCGLCAERCPTGAWDMQKFRLDTTQAGPLCRDARATPRMPEAA